MISKPILYIAAVCICAILVCAGCAAPKSPAPLEPPPVPVNNPPAISSLTADRQLVQPFGKVMLKCQASDPESDNLSYRWTASGGLLEGSADSASWTAPGNPGSYKITVVVSNEKGGTATGDIFMTIPEKPNNAPAISAIKFTRPNRMAITVKTNPTEEDTKKTPDLVIKQWVETADIACLATDPDKDQLTYVWKATGGKLIGNGPNIRWVAPVAGTYKITCEVADGNGGADSFTFSVTVKCCN